MVDEIQDMVDGLDICSSCWSEKKLTTVSVNAQVVIAKILNEIRKSLLVPRVSFADKSDPPSIEEARRAVEAMRELREIGDDSVRLDRWFKKWCCKLSEEKLAALNDAMTCEERKLEKEGDAPSAERLQALKHDFSGVTDRMYEKVAAMERLQELVNAGKCVVIQRSSVDVVNVIVDDENEIEIKYTPKWRCVIGTVVSETILNIKIEEGELHG